MNYINHFQFDDKGISSINETEIPSYYTTFKNNFLVNPITFVYRIVTENKLSLKEIYSIIESKEIINKIEILQDCGYKTSFCKIESDIIHSNLTLLDSYLPNILSELLLIYHDSDYSTLKDSVEELTIRNPILYDLSMGHPFYENKVKQFLNAIILGMTPSKVWSGVSDSTGGYLVVKENGEVLCYHVYNRNQFEDYLYANTKLETASSTRHDFGKVYTENGNYFFKLNLQIRFI